MNSFLFLAFTFLVGFPVICAEQDEDWPKECKGKSYCTIKTEKYPYKEFESILVGANMTITPLALGDRVGDEKYDDIASCGYTSIKKPVYMIKDENNKIRYVAQIPNKLTFVVFLEECPMHEPLEGNPIHLKRDELKDKPVVCYERRVKLQFPVLSLDYKNLESVPPTGGIPISCTAKYTGHY